MMITYSRNLVVTYYPFFNRYIILINCFLILNLLEEAHKCSKQLNTFCSSELLRIVDVAVNEHLYFFEQILR